MRKPSREQLCLALEEIEIWLRNFARSGDDRVAAAEEAPCLAEREMHVKRKRSIAQRVGGLEPLEIVVAGEALVELDGRRAAGVARPRPVVAGEE